MKTNVKEAAKAKTTKKVEKIEEVKAAKKVVQKPYIAEEVSTDEEEMNAILEKNTIAGKVVKEKKEKVIKEKKEKAEVLHRQDSVISAVKELCKKGATLKVIMDRANEIHIAAGGESNPTATNVNRYSLAALVAFEVLTLNEKGVYTLAK